MNAIAIALFEDSPPFSTIVGPSISTIVETLAMEPDCQTTMETSSGHVSSHITTLSHTQLSHAVMHSNLNPTLDAVN